MLSINQSRRKSTGGLSNTHRRRDKILANNINHPTKTTVATTEKRKIIRGLGGNKKIKAVEVKFANIHIDKNKSIKAEIIKVLENKAHKEFVRRNTITKGAIISIKLNSEIKKAQVTSRPGQNGIVSAKII